MFDKFFHSRKQKLITPETISDACDNASQLLNSLLDTHNIKIRLEAYGSKIVSSSFKSQWGVHNNHINWGDPLIHSWTNQQSGLFTFGLFTGATLSALCELGLNSDINSKTLEINFIEKAPPHVQNPLDGFTIAACAQLSLDLAKNCNIERIGVNRPKLPTVPSYLRLGYKFNLFSSNIITKRVTPTTELYWEKLLKRTQSRKVVASTSNSSPATP